MIKNGERRRTPGGVFLQLLRDMGADEEDNRVDQRQIKLFFAQSNRDHHQGNNKKKRKPKEDFKSELEAFKKFNSKNFSTVPWAAGGVAELAGNKER